MNQLSLIEQTLLMVLADLRESREAEIDAATLHAALATKLPWPVSRGGIYHALLRLKRRRLLACRLSDPRGFRGGRARQLYSLERRGWQVLRTIHELFVECAPNLLAGGFDSLPSETTAAAGEGGEAIAWIRWAGSRAQRPGVVGTLPFRPGAAPPRRPTAGAFLSSSPRRDATQER